MVVRQMVLRVLQTVFMVALVATQPGESGAEEFPTRPVRIIAWGAGTFPDIISRMLADHLTVVWKQPVVVINRPGAGGILAAKEAANSPADGYTIVWSDPVGWFFSKEYVNPGQQYSATDDLTPLSYVVEAPQLIGVSAKLPVSNFKEFIEFSRSAKQPLAYGSPGFYSWHHLSVELLAQQIGARFQQIPYKSLSDAVPAVMSGEIALAMTALGSYRGALSTGKVRPIAVSGPRRIDSLPDVPAVSELFPDYVMTAKGGFFIHSRTPPVLIQQISRAIADGVRSPNIAAYIRESGSDPVGGTAQEFEVAVARDIKLLKPVADAVKNK